MYLIECGWKWFPPLPQVHRKGLFTQKSTPIASPQTFTILTGHLLVTFAFSFHQLLGYSHSSIHLSSYWLNIYGSNPTPSSLYCCWASKKFHGNSTNNHDLEFIPSAMPRSPESSCCSSPTLNPCSSAGGSVAGDTGLDLPDLDFNLK